MNIVSGKPPNFADIVAVFPEAKRKGVVFAYGDTIYINGAAYLSPELRSHEGAHLERQKANGPDAWWSRYLTDQAFRLEEEIIGHRAEYQTARNLMKDRNRLAAAFDTIAKRLSSPLYGNMISYSEARRMILA